MISSPLASRVARFLSLVRRIAGMPDYPVYLAHLRSHHPECPVPSEREYFEQYLAARYDKGASRCC